MIKKLHHHNLIFLNEKLMLFIENHKLYKQKFIQFIGLCFLLSIYLKLNTLY